ncbi:uncharacterized protein [Chelonus insularis]|uniref:uncharacterized protein n=1 Tax=Chelonus insularis TaxID=460826 RepID=UPI00158ABD0C|nr:uncharacterized protein LOC118072252 [Chelonus insularis]
MTFIMSLIIFIFFTSWLKDINADESASNLMVVTTERTSLTTESYKSPRSYIYRRGNYEDHHDDDEMPETDEMEDSKALEAGKNEYWGGYYDFLINEGSYKFWAVFQLATAALLIYSGFAALYYAKVNPMTTDDYDELFRRRKRHAGPMVFSIDNLTFQRIIEALEKYNIN